MQFWASAIASKQCLLGVLGGILPIAYDKVEPQLLSLARGLGRQALMESRRCGEPPALPGGMSASKYRRGVGVVRLDERSERWSAFPPDSLRNPLRGEWGGSNMVTFASR